MCYRSSLFCLLFFFNDTATTEIYTLSLHDALPISFPLLLAALSSRLRPLRLPPRALRPPLLPPRPGRRPCVPLSPDRKSTRLNSSHANISYAVFCLKKKKPSPICILVILWQ